jgi:PTS hybrid protein
MAENSANGFVGLVLVSHSAAIADGLAELIAQVAGPEVPIVAAGGGPAGSFGTDGAKVQQALRRAADGAGAVVLMDLGSSILSVRAALEELPDGARERLRIADAPFVEGAVAAAVAASTGAPIAAVADAAEEARTLAKL